MKKGMKKVLFLIFTIIWSIIVYVLNGEWLHFIPLLVADILFLKQLVGSFGKRKKKEKKKKSELRTLVEAIAFAVVAAHILRTFLLKHTPFLHHQWKNLC